MLIACLKVICICHSTRLQLSFPITNFSDQREDTTMKLFNHTLRLLSLAAVLVLGLSAVAFAQETTGRITGQVVDPAGAIVSKAELTLTNVATHEMRKAQTDESGNYTF